MKKYKDYLVIIVILALIFISIMFLSILNRDNDVNDDNEIVKNYKLENDYSKFFTVNSCIYKYIEYLSKKETNKLLLILNDDYIVNNQINSSNIYEYLDDLDGTFTFTSKKMYKDDSKDVITYYVYGYLTEETIDGIANKTLKYYILNMDENNLTFDIMPSDSIVFSEVENG